MAIDEIVFGDFVHRYGPGDDIDNGQVSDKHVGSYDDSRAGELNASSVPTDLRSI